MVIKLKEAIEHFGPPDYTYTYDDRYGDGCKSHYWFRFNMMFSSNKFEEIIIKRKWFGKEKLYWKSGKECHINIQIAWQMHQADNILLGDEDA